jgi:hypothetical protein
MLAEHLPALRSKGWLEALYSADEMFRVQSCLGSC